MDYFLLMVYFGWITNHLWKLYFPQQCCQPITFWKKESGIRIRYLKWLLNRSGVFLCQNVERSCKDICTEFGKPYNHSDNIWLYSTLDSNVKNNKNGILLTCDQVYYCPSPDVVSLMASLSMQQATIKMMINSYSYPIS